MRPAIGLFRRQLHDTRQCSRSLDNRTAAIAAEGIFSACSARKIEPFSSCMNERDPACLDAAQLAVELLAERQAGSPVELLCARFHQTLAAWALAVAQQQRTTTTQLVLSGGCFQNALLTRLVCDALNEAGFCVYTPHHLPQNDGAIAAGQAYVASHQPQRPFGLNHPAPQR